MPLETYYVFEEAKSSFVYGQFVASIVLAAAFVEHWLSSYLSSRGFERQAKRGLAAMVEYCRKNDLLNATLLDKIDRLRRIRNPFVHLKSFDYPDRVTHRSMQQRSHPQEILEGEAKDSLALMYTVAVHAKM